MSDIEPKARLEREEIERILRDAHILERRDDRLGASARLKQAVTDHPQEADLWEAYGDLLADAEQYEQARDAYFQAKEIQKPRLNAERKYADMVYRLSSKDLPLITEDAPGSPMLALCLSLMLPGAGQYYNQQLQKAGICFGVWTLCMIPIVVVWRSLGTGSGGRLTVSSWNAAINGFTSGPGLWLLFLLLGVAGYSAIDAYTTAKRANDAFGGPLFSKKDPPKMPDASFFDDVVKKPADAPEEKKDKA